MKTPAYTIGETFVSVTFLEDGASFVINKNNEPNRFEQAIGFLKVENWEDLRDYLTPTKYIEKVSDGEITIMGDIVKYKGMLVDNIVCDRILSCVRKDLPYKNLSAFLKNILESMSKSVLRELYLYLENAKSMPILDDGSFLAYRYVQNDYRSCTANPDGTFNRNRVGDIVTMDRDECDHDRNETCSRGLHFCSYEYLPQYRSGKRIMIVKVFPQDVVAIPNDYGNQKARCCKYEVVGEVDAQCNSAYKLPESECNAEAKTVATKLDSGEVAKPASSVEFTQAEADKVIEILTRRTEDGRSVEVRKASKVTKPYINVDKFLAIVDSYGSGFTYEPTEPKSKTIIKAC